MSGICGIWNLEGTLVDQALLVTMTATMAHRGPDGEGVWARGPVGMACQHLQVTPESIGAPQPLVHPSGCVLVFDGRLDNRDELCREPKISAVVDPASPDTEYILAAYHAYGLAFPERLIGDFALALFDPAWQRLILVRDAIGVRPLYYCQLDGLLIFATEIKALLAHPLVTARTNDGALAEYLLGRRPRFDFSGVTFFDGVFSVPPAHIAIQSPGQFQVSRYWDFDPNHKVRFSSPAEYAQAFRHYFEQSVRRRMRSAAPVAVSVSGGLDSSSIFCMAQTLRQIDPNAIPECQGFSYTLSDGGVADERTYIEDIESRYRVQVERVPLTPSGFVEGARASMWFNEDPMVDAQATFGQHYWHSIRKAGARVLLTGHWGDQVLAGTDHLVDLFHQLAWGKLWIQLQELPRWETDAGAYSSNVRGFLKQLFLQHVPDAWIPALKSIRVALGGGSFDSGTRFFTKEVKSFVRETANVEPASGPRFSSRYASILYEQARNPYYVQCLEWNNKNAAMQGFDAAFPFLDRDLLCFMIAIPGDMAQKDGIARWILRKAMDTILPKSIQNRRWKADFTLIANQGTSQDLPRLLDDLASHSRIFSCGYVEETMMLKEITKLKSSDWSESFALSRTLCTLYGLDLWLSTFFSNSYKRIQ